MGRNKELKVLGDVHVEVLIFYEGKKSNRRVSFSSVHLNLSQSPAQFY